MNVGCFPGRVSRGKAQDSVELVDIEGGDLERKEEGVTEVRGGSQDIVQSWTQGYRV